MRDVLVVLARAPAAGEGKTRLRGALRGCDDAHVDRLVAALAEDTLEWASQSRALVVAGAGEGSRLRELAPLATHVAQPATTFGARIEGALAAGSAMGARVVQIGTDSPTLPAALIDAAFAALRSSDDAALVPAIDGGWVALGLARPPRGALERAPVRWSTEHAAADTVAALRAAGRRVVLLPPWYDVDDAASLRRLQRDPLAPTLAPRTLTASYALTVTSTMCHPAPPLGT